MAPQGNPRPDQGYGEQPGHDQRSQPPPALAEADERMLTECMRGLAERLRRSGLSWHEAEEMTHEAVVRWLGRYASRPFSRDDLERLLFVMARRAYVNAGKRNRTAVENRADVARLAGRPGDNPLDLLVRGEAAECYQKAFAALPEKHRDVWRLRYHECQSVGQIAQDYAVSEKTIQNRLKAARRRLHLRLKHYGQE